MFSCSQMYEQFIVSRSERLKQKLNIEFDAFIREEKGLQKLTFAGRVEMQKFDFLFFIYTFIDLLFGQNSF